jgi:hypothetical protein
MTSRKKTPRTLGRTVPLAGLRYWRRLRNLSVAELTDELRARDCWVGAPHVYKWESGARECATIYARQLAEILDVTLEQLLATPPARAQRSET